MSLGSMTYLIWNDFMLKVQLKDNSNQPEIGLSKNISGPLVKEVKVLVTLK